MGNGAERLIVQKDWDNITTTRYRITLTTQHPTGVAFELSQAFKVEQASGFTQHSTVGETVWENAAPVTIQHIHWVLTEDSAQAYVFTCPQ